MSYNFNDDTPIYLQIIEHIKIQIISKRYLPKQRNPSVRELSFEFEVNPNTIQKALQELEEIGLIYTESTNGKFVTDNEKLIEIIKEETIKEETIKEMIDKFYNSMSKIGIEREEILQILINKRSKK